MTGTGGMVPAGDTFEPVPPELQSVLLRYSRLLLEHSLLRAAGSGTAGEPRPPRSEVLSGQRPGVFVTLRHQGKLRGCVGSITGEEPLVQAIRRRSLDAAFRDRRFPPLRAEELGLLSIEHSLLSPLEDVEEPEAIRIGEHGVVMTVEGARALFLPEVALQHDWDLDKTLASLSLKAGLPEDAWRREDARFQVFRTQHYGEEI